MTNFDVSRLFRSTVGFDALSRVMDAAPAQTDNGYPPYNIEKAGPDTYRISLALAGFTAEDLEVVSHEGVLTVRGKARAADEKVAFLYRSIAARAFERRFQLADYVEARGAHLENGLLQIELVRRAPEALKARRIEIAAAPAGKATAEAVPLSNAA